MRRKAALVAVAILFATAIAASWLRSEPLAHARARRSDAIRAVVDTTGEAGWIETFDAPAGRPLAELDPRWHPIFGRLLVDPRLGAAIGDPEGGWVLDGGDDYAFRSGPGLSSMEITADGWWDGEGSIGVQGAVQAEPPHRFYEAALWRGGLALLYFVGPAPDQFEVLAEQREPALSKGFYRLIFCLTRDDDVWHLRAELRDPARNYGLIRRISAIDRRLAEGSQGIGLLGGGGRRAPYITGVAMRAPVVPDCS